MKPPVKNLIAAAIESASFPVIFRLLVALNFTASLALNAAAPVTVDFKRDIAPIFIKRCFECHGPDQQKSKLRLDTKAEAFRGGKSGKSTIVPGKSSESEIIHRVTSMDPDEVMPSKGEKLTSEQINLLRAWIDQGALWPEEKTHWAFIKPARPELPALKNKKWPRNEIDHFILARLEKEKLSPSPESDRATLIRRLTLDLTGLPPTPAAVSAFLKDRSNAAYETLVNRLLDSPHFGEHFARWWLDLARYADSNGYQVDLARSVWPYREWVINAFNKNMPFDQFTIEQLAGDLLPHASLEQKIATGFNRNSKINDEGGGDAEEYRTKAVKDRVATTSSTWLGLTMMCAECHTHKYDPITQEDYYRFYALFNNTTDGGNYSLEPTVAVPAPPVQNKVNYFRSHIGKLQGELAAADKNLPLEQAVFERRIAGKTNVWVTLSLTNALSTGGSTYTNLADQSLLATGVNPTYDTIFVEAETDLQNITAVLLEVLPDPSLPKNGPGRWGATGNFILDEFAASALPLKARLAASARTESQDLTAGVSQTGSTSSSSASSRKLADEAVRAPFSPNLVFSKATADWEQQYYRAEHAIDRNPKTGWAIGPRFGQPHFLIAELNEPAGFAGGTKLGFRFEHYHGNNHSVGRIRLSVTTEKDSAVLWPVSSEMMQLLAVPATKRTEDQRRQLAARYRSVSPTIRKIERELLRLNQREAELASAKFSTLVLQERTEPRPTYIHVRGNFLEKGKEVKPGAPAVFPPLPANEPANRLALARWLMNPENPLPARVTVNRLWERFFGTGLVKTSEDFGKQGEAPTHPELLDWLACEFMQPTSAQHAPSTLPHSWDVKHTVKLLVMSATYRQSAAASDKLLEKDLYNRLLARGPRFRMDAEMIRDQALAVSGLLNLEIGGPSVYPVQVSNLWKEIGFLRPEIGMDEWPTSDGPDLYRRAVYTFWRRVCTYPTLATFDAPSREVCLARRPRTNTPLQALAGLNEPTLLEAARVLAQRILLQGGSSLTQQIDFAVRLCLSRPPTKAEQQRLLKLYQQQLKSFEHDSQAAETLVNVGSAERSANLDTRRLAAWMMVANVLLNLDETLTKG